MDGIWCHTATIVILWAQKCSDENGLMKGDWKWLCRVDYVTEKKTFWFWLDSCGPNEDSHQTRHVNEMVKRFSAESVINFSASMKTRLATENWPLPYFRSFKFKCNINLF